MQAVRQKDKEVRFGYMSIILDEEVWKWKDKRDWREGAGIKNKKYI